jgi:hypothetical protein
MSPNVGWVGGRVHATHAAWIVTCVLRSGYAIG